MFLSDHQNIVKSLEISEYLEEVYSLPCFARLKSLNIGIDLFLDSHTLSDTYGYCRTSTSIERLYVDADVIIVLFQLSIKNLEENDIKGLICHLISGIDASYKQGGTPVVYTNKGYYQVSIDVLQQYGKNLSMYKDIFEVDNLEESCESGIKGWGRERNDKAKRDKTRNFIRR